ncbi:MAG: Ni/Fe-hydrogenase cytochrome b subunit [Planctomycetes bacterium]|nr:Ni/Fe-hydrogenase cytochrome b subunit [Planctomycetota bacterium]
METKTRFRLGFWRIVFLALLAVGLPLSYIRFTEGLGAVTNMSDVYPWGLWVGFKLCFIGLAGAGFVITGVVHIFRVERLHPIARPAILTAFLGYLLVVTALLFDLGLPWNIWHPMVMWNPHSVMFEVSWCVMLYTSVLALEFSSMLFERLGWTKLVKAQKAVIVPLVIAGVVLSTLHQSSLGTMFLIVPGKLHALWYTPIIPVLFFVSSICAGLAMVIFESRFIARVTKKPVDTSMLAIVGHALFWVLCVYAILRFGDLVARDALTLGFGMGYESLLFQLEVLPGLLLPIVLLANPKVRSSMKGLYASSALVMFGFIANRFDVSITGFEAAQGGHYVPAWQEFVIMLMWVAIGFAAFSFAVRHLPVTGALEKPVAPGTVEFEEHRERRAPRTGLSALPQLDRQP